MQYLVLRIPIPLYLVAFIAIVALGILGLAICCIPEYDTEIEPGASSSFLPKSLDSVLYEHPFPWVAPDPVRQAEIKQAFRHQWTNYDRHCFGHDNFKPLSLKCEDDALRGGLSIIDALSTLIVMNLTQEYQKAKEFVANDFRPDGQWSLFEFIIRYLGGLLSAADLTGDRVFVDASKAVGYAILPIIEATDGFFDSGFTIRTKGLNKFKAKGRSAQRLALAEAGSFQMEFLTLARITGDERFVVAALNVYRRLWKSKPKRGLMSPGLGGGSDSYYEYILKSYLLTGGFSRDLLRRYLLVVKDVKEKLIFRTERSNLTAVAGFGRPSGRIMDHFATFTAGLLALGSVERNPKASEDLALADDLAETLWHLYTAFPAGLMPEAVEFPKQLYTPNSPEFEVSRNGYRLRPESVESLYFLWKFTGLPKYREYAWSIFLGINRSCRADHGFAVIREVQNEEPTKMDETESFFMAETLKYLYLIFSDSGVLSPTEWVFNTEAHPFRIWNGRTMARFRHLFSLPRVR
jgi:mannosyl-oligosaccharide alpha-1,2-mannosidase